MSTGLLLSFLVPLVFLGLLAIWTRSSRGAGVRLRYGILAFAAGAASATVAYFVFEALGLLPSYPALFEGGSDDDLVRAVFALWVVGPVEEACKLGAVVLSVWRIRGAVPPGRAVVFTSAAALGFAATENWYSLWTLGYPDLGRIVLLPFVHALFASLCGWGLDRSRQENGRSWPVYLGLLLAAIYHGLYDFAEFRAGPWHYATFPLVVLLWLFLTRMVRKGVSIRKS